MANDEATVRTVVREADSGGRMRWGGRTAMPTYPAPLSIEIEDDRPAASQSSNARWLKRLTQGLDLLSLLAGWLLAYLTVTASPFAGPADEMPLRLLGLTGGATALMVVASRRLWLARVCAVRSAELQGLGAAAMTSALVVLAAGQVIDYNGHDRYAVLGPSYSFALMVVCRASLTAWLKSVRRRGRLARRLVLVGADAHARHLATLLERHPGMGYQVVGICGRREDVIRHGLSMPWLGGHDTVERAIADTGANGALLVASALDHDELNNTARALLAAGRHVHVSSALSGISHERLVPLPLAREPLFYLERSTLAPAQLALKRIADVTIGLMMVVVALPVLAAIALIIKLDDGGPVLFRQRRVGHRGEAFTLFKLRTMVTDAEGRRADLERRNGRAGGPLFKVERDPRITRVGRWLRITSLDELPQLFNVLRGDMSLVGPRPALPHEVAQFDEELRRRHRVMPGLTGLWQVEGRDDPSFDSYRRLDLYYVENWSIGLDLAILCTTIGAVAKRSFRMAVTGAGAS